MKKETLVAFVGLGIVSITGLVLSCRNIEMQRRFSRRIFTLEEDVEENTIEVLEHIRVLQRNVHNLRKDYQALAKRINHSMSTSEEADHESN